MRETKRVDPIVKVQAMLKKDGAEGWNMAKEILLNQETEDPQLKQALKHVTLFPDFFRPAFISYCCEAVEGNPKITIPISASLILLAKAIGIHDSIIDRTKKRDNQATIFGKFGKETALILSDILFFKGFTLLRRNLEMGIPSSTIIRILETIDHVWFEQSEGALLDFRLRKSLDITPEEYLRLITKKASELEALARIGGILGQGSQEEIEILGEIGRILGTMCLLRDEVIDMLEFNVLKHRIKYELLPLPVIYAAQKPNIKTRILRVISKKEPTIKDAKRLLQFVDEVEGINQVASRISERAEKIKQYTNLLKRNRRKFQVIADSLILHPYEWKPIVGG